MQCCRLNHAHPARERILALGTEVVHVILERQLEHEVLEDAVFRGGGGNGVAKQGERS